MRDVEEGSCRQVLEGERISEESYSEESYSEENCRKKSDRKEDCLDHFADGASQLVLKG